MFEKYDEGEKTRNFRLTKVKIGIFLAICAVSLIALGISKWSEASLHEKLMNRHEKTTANFEPPYFKNGSGTNVTYAIGYNFTVNGKAYRNVAYSKINPKYPRGIVLYNPDDPEENELQPIPIEEAYTGTDR